MSLERDGVGVPPSIGGMGPSVGPALAPTAGDPRSLLLQEMRDQNFDVIRFATYRTACKLRYVQKKCNCHGHTAVSILLELHGFWAYENREALAAHADHA